MPPLPSDADDPRAALDAAIEELGAATTAYVRISTQRAQREVGRDGGRVGPVRGTIEVEPPIRSADPIQGAPTTSPPGDAGSKRQDNPTSKGDPSRTRNAGLNEQHVEIGKAVERPSRGQSRLWSTFRWLLIVVALLVVVGAGVWWYFSSPASAATIVGVQRDVPPAGLAQVDTRVGSENPRLVGTVTKIIDGDGIWVSLSSGPIEIRFHSIDAPERDQAWGAEAAAALARRVDGKQVALDVVTQDQYDRLVAVVYLGDENLNVWMVKQGHAWAFRRYLKDRRYCSWEAEARSAGSGLWSLPKSRWQAPWEWRAVKRKQRRGFSDYSEETVANCVAAIGKREVPASSTAATAPMGFMDAPTSGNCRIKGNISDSGRIYHLPGSSAYDKTRIDESKGERWFCSEAEARSAGWRGIRQ